MSHFIPYGKQTLETDDIEAVLAVLQENRFLTTGPRVAQFEQAMCDYISEIETCPSLQAVAVNSGTAALHAAVRAIQLKPGDEVIVPAISFAATSNCVLYEKGIPVFCDIEEDTMNLDPTKVTALITQRTRAIIAVDFAGQAANYLALKEICHRYNLYLIADAAHSVGLRSVKWFPGMNKLAVGTLADITATSFHPVKNMTTAEGGMCFTANPIFAKRMRRFRNHGIDVEYQQRVSHSYDIVELGYNYRLNDLQCALGISQLKKVQGWIHRRQELAKRYDEAFKPLAGYVTPLTNRFGSAYHIYVLKFHFDQYYSQFTTPEALAEAKERWNRDVIFQSLRTAGIGVNVHYKPIYLLSFYQQHPKILTNPGLCPVAEQVYDQIITLPLFPTMTDGEQHQVIEAVKTVLEPIQTSSPRRSVSPELVQDLQKIKRDLQHVDETVKKTRDKFRRV